MGNIAPSSPEDQTENSGSRSQYYEPNLIQFGQNQGPVTKQSIPIKLAIINPSKIKSPYFYNNQDTDLSDQLDQLYHKLREFEPSKAFNPDNLSEMMYWNKTIDKGRYSPLLNQYAGIDIQLMVLMNQEQFIEAWNRQYEKFEQYNSGLVSKTTSQLTLQDISVQLRYFDLLCYQALLSFLYTSLPSNQPNPTFQSILQYPKLSHYYRAFQSKVFDTIPIQTKRIKQLAEHLEANQYDVVVMQQADTSILDYLIQLTSNYRYSSIVQYDNAGVHSLYPIICLRQSVSRKMKMNEVQAFLPLKEHNRRHIEQIEFYHKLIVQSIGAQKQCDEKILKILSHSKKGRKKLQPIEKKNERSSKMVLEQQNNLFSSSLKLGKIKTSEKIAYDAIDNLDKFDFIQFFGNLIIISNRSEVELSNGQSILNELSQILFQFSSHFNKYSIILALTVESRFTSQIINPKMVQDIFKKHDFQVYPTVSSCPGTHFISTNEPNILSENVFTINNKYPLAYFQSKLGTSETGIKDYIITNTTIQTSQIQTICGSKPKVQNPIPDHDHPFSHYILTADVLTKSIEQDENQGLIKKAFSSKKIQQR